MKTETENTYPHFGTYGLTGWQDRITQTCRQLPTNWIGRRLALILRKMVIKSSKLAIMDGEIDGIKLRCRTKDNISERKFYFMPQFCDAAERHLIANMLPEDGVFLDIGANAGIYTLTAAHQCKQGGKVIAIEPNPVVLARLQENLAMNDYADRVTIVQKGVSDTPGSFTLLLDDTNLGGSSLVTKRSETGGEITVDCQPLADILNDLKIEQVHMMKIDIEGAEEKALIPFFKTAPTSLFPKYIIIENSTDDWETDLMGYMAEHGYGIFKQTKMNYILAHESAA